jgi:hypothetical protein
MQLPESFQRWLWNYLRGWVIIAVTGALIGLVGKAYARVRPWFAPFFDDVGSGYLAAALAASTLIIVPWALGGMWGRALRALRSNRGWRAFERMEDRLATELRPDEVHGFRIALVNFPTESNRTLGVVPDTHEEPGTGRELASVYLPGTPDPTKGSLRVVAAEDLVFVDWSLKDLIRYYATFGSAGADFDRSSKVNET